jgi:hypothetical protein
MAGNSKKRRRHNKNIPKSEENQKDFASSGGLDQNNPLIEKLWKRWKMVLVNYNNRRSSSAPNLIKFQADKFQQQQTRALNVRMDEIEQKFLSSELALTGLPKPNLTNISADTILKKILSSMVFLWTI